MTVRLLVLAVAAGLLVAGPCRAQSNDRLPPTNAVGVWGSGSLSTGGLIGNIQRARVGLLGLRYRRLLAPSAPHARPLGPTLTYTVDVIPVLSLSIPSDAIPAPPPSASDVKTALTTYGVGVRPAGLRLTYRNDARVHPFLAGSTGLAYFTHPVPSDRGKSLNFMFDVGAGLQVTLSPALALTVGYRYYHLSNGFRGQINPGVDANLVQLGLTVAP